nr:hypothetical protein [Candidatus Njordarchaeota archaeon]
MLTDRKKLASMNLGNETHVERIVFDAISDIASVELLKVEAELTRQLDRILGEIEHKEGEVLGHPCGGEFFVDTVARVKRVLRQLFLHLQRVLVLNVAQNLSERLTELVKELSEKAMGAEAENEQLSSQVRGLREKLSDLSKRIKDYERRTDQIGKKNGLESVDYEKIDESVARLFGRTHQATEMLVEFSKKYQELKEENNRIKQQSIV